MWLRCTHLPAAAPLRESCPAHRSCPWICPLCETAPGRPLAYAVYHTAGTFSQTAVGQQQGGRWNLKAWFKFKCHSWLDLSTELFFLNQQNYTISTNFLVWQDGNSTANFFGLCLNMLLGWLNLGFLFFFMHFLKHWVTAVVLHCVITHWKSDLEDEHLQMRYSCGWPSSGRWLGGLRAGKGTSWTKPPGCWQDPREWSWQVYAPWSFGGFYAPTENWQKIMNELTKLVNTLGIYENKGGALWPVWGRPLPGWC